MPDLEISRLPALSGSSLQAVDPIPLTDLSASETKKVTAKDLIQYGVALIDAGSIPSDKVVFAPPAGSIGTLELKDNSVTALKLADGSSGIVQLGPLPTGEFVGQLGLDLSDSQFYVWNGGAWHKVKASGSINAIAGAATGLLEASVAVSAGTATITVKHVDTSVAAHFLAGPTGGAGAVTQRAIVGTDLPPATDTDLGAVVAGGGLDVDASGVLSVDNAVTPQSGRSLATWNGHGLVTGGSPIQPTDLPIASAGTLGAVYPGSSLTVSPAGELMIDNTVAANTYARVTINGQGLVVAGSDLTPSDIPALDAAKITTGVFDPSLFGKKQITREMLADYSISHIQEATPPLTGNHIGALWYQESTAGLHMWNGNSWMPISIGRLSQENLRYSGTINATTGLVTGVTSLGTAAGYKIGDALKNATDQLTGTYFVVETPGSGISHAAVIGITFDNGDWVLCNGAAAGYVRIDTLSGGGGGSSINKLSDLLDVTLTTPVQDDVLQFNAAGQWVNVTQFDEGLYG